MCTLLNSFHFILPWTKAISTATILACMKTMNYSSGFYKYQQTSEARTGGKASICCSLTWTGRQRSTPAGRQTILRHFTCARGCTGQAVTLVASVAYCRTRDHRTNVPITVVWKTRVSTVQAYKKNKSRLLDLGTNITTELTNSDSQVSSAKKRLL